MVHGLLGYEVARRKPAGEAIVAFSDSIWFRGFREGALTNYLTALGNRTFINFTVLSEEAQPWNRILSMSFAWLELALKEVTTEAARRTPTPDYTICSKQKFANSSGLPQRSGLCSGGGKKPKNWFRNEAALAPFDVPVTEQA